MTKSKMKSCDDCSAEISRVAETCPRCGRSFRKAMTTGSLIRDVFYATLFIAAVKVILVGA